MGRTMELGLKKAAPQTMRRKFLGTEVPSSTRWTLLAKQVIVWIKKMLRVFKDRRFITQGST